MNEVLIALTTALSTTLDEFGIDKVSFLKKLQENFNKYKEYEQVVEDEVIEKAREVKEESKDYNNSDEFLEA